MRRIHYWLSALAVTAVVAPNALEAESRRLDCAAAARITLAGARITETRVVTPPDSLRARGQRVRCRVAAVVDEETRIVALLPEEWNGKFLMGGGGGFVGLVENQFSSSVHEGYATVGTNTGHEGHPLNAQWAFNNPRRVEEFGHRAVHRTAVVTKALITAYYGRAPQRSYFIGCSNGGRQGLMEAQRYPDDFDGIVSIAPAYEFTAIAASFIRNLQVQYPTANFAAPVLTPDVFRVMGSRVMSMCDATDGAKDGVIENPESCAFQLSSLPACTNDVAKGDCVTKAQRAALATIASPLNAGGVHYPGQPFGNEGDEGGLIDWLGGPSQEIVQVAGAPSVQGAFGTQLFKYMVYNDSTWRYVGYDLSRVARDAAAVGAQLNATNADLSAFVKRGGKLILAHGWSDPALNARATIDYYKQVQVKTPNAAGATRLFMMPGVLHCEGGSGCDQVEWATALDTWVERGVDPNRIVAGKIEKGVLVRTHPLCAYPATARYDGKGKTTDAASFLCQQEKR